MKRRKDNQAEGLYCTKALRHEYQGRKEGPCCSNRESWGAWHMNEPAMEGGQNHAVMRAMVKDFVFIRKALDIPWSLKCNMLKKRNSSPWTLISLPFFSFFFLFSRCVIHSESKTKTWRHLPGSTGHWDQSTLPSTYASNLCHFYHRYLV